MLIEITTFRLTDGADRAAFLEADKRLQAVLSPRPGFVRRTTASGSDGEWLVLTFWDSAADADADVADPAVAAFDALVDPTTRTVKRFRSLD